MKEEKIQELQLLEQNMTHLQIQKQKFETQQVEVDSALSELGNTNEAFRIIGNVMVKVDIPRLQKELDEKKEMLAIRVKTLENQEEKLKEKAVNLQKDLLSDMKSK
tara:strand:+ start:170 stop:487 length:318 start_codon:yes stop_codon:yes gene_type:complete